MLLVAHPAMRDPNFRESVVLISANDAQEGSIGVVVNRPLGTTLGEQSEEFLGTALAEVPIYEGGPVQPDQILLAAWKNLPDQGMFQLFFGLSEDKASELANDPTIQLKAYRGYAGWSKGQLEGEHDKNAWLLLNVIQAPMDATDEPTFWRRCIHEIRPELLFLVDVPDDPSLN